MIARARSLRWLPAIFGALAVAFGARILAPRASVTREGVTYLAYRVAAGQPLAFPVAPQDRDVALTVQLESGGDPEASERFDVRVALADAAGNELWHGQGEVEAKAGALIVEDQRPATTPRTLRLDLPEVPEGAQLTVAAIGARPALLRLTRRTTRTSLSGEADAPRDPRGLGARASVFGWPYLDIEARDILLEQPIIRRSATGRQGAGAELVHIRLLPSMRAAPAQPEPGELLEGARGLAYTVRGPGRLRVVVTPIGGQPASLQLATLNQSGASTSEHASIEGEGKELAYDPPAGGALTVSLLAPSTPVRVRAYVAGGATQLGKPPGETEILPDRRREVLWRARPAGPPVLATLAGDGTARVELRAPAGPARIHWRVLDGERLVAQGVMPVLAMPSLFERLRPETPDAEPAIASLPMTLMASGPPGARLEIAALAAPVDVSIAAPDSVEEAELDEAYAVTLTHTRLRFAPYLRRRFVPFIPDNHAALAVSAGRAVLEGQVRLEPVGGRPRPTGPWKTLEPEPPRTRQLIAEVADDGDLLGFATGKPALLRVPATGADAGRVLLAYLLDGEALGGTLRVLLDGQPAEERQVNVTRGRIRLRDVAPGAHQVTVEAAPGTIFTATPGAGGQKFAEREVWRLDRGKPITVAVPVPAGRALTLNVVLYSETGVGRVPELGAHVEIDAHRGPGLRAATARTNLARDLRVPVEAIRSVWLDSQGGAVARARFAVRLGEDLGGGMHRVHVSLGPDAPARMHARFFVTGQDSDPHVSWAGTEWAED